MEKQKNIPQLRFPDFKGEWEKKKLGELSAINPTTDKLPEKFIYIDLESVINGDLTKEVFVFKNAAPSRAQRVLERDDILFQMVRPYQKNNLYFDKSGDYVASTGYAQIKTKQNSRFIYQYLHLQKFVDEVIERCTGTSYPAINSKDLAKISIRYPSLPEQQKIASFFTAIDLKISQLKRKKILLEQYKKGVMQKIFSQEIRFKDDNGQEFPKWEKRKIRELFRVTRGNVLATNNLKSEKEFAFCYPVYSSQTTNNGLLGYYNDYLFEDCITWTTDGANAGDVNYRKGKFYCTNVCGVLESKEGYANQCIAEILNSIAKRHVAYVGNPKLMNNVMAGIEINIPASITEQIKISNFLSAIDDKINHTQKQVEKAEVWKKGLMQQMFC